MSVALTQDRLKRLMDSGLREMCRPAQRVLELRKRAEQVDKTTIVRLEQLFFGLADRTRLRIIDLLTNEELCACEIMAALHMTQPNTSHHLRILERTGLVETRREGKWVFYRPSPSVKMLYSKGVTSVRKSGQNA
jgi:DNA-binding transcriptional ArsR family regulator